MIILIKFKNFFEFIKEPLLAVLAALLISQFLIMHTRIPSGSMIPTINKGDHLIVNLIPNYYREPKRGEIVVFEYNGENLIKRVIGMPGDEIDLIDGKVYINKEEIDETAYIHTFNSTREYVGSEVDFPYIVPENSYFMMGDNREGSADSRIFGSISKDKIIAIGAFKIYPLQAIGVLK